MTAYLTSPYDGILTTGTTSLYDIIYDILSDSRNDKKAASEVISEARQNYLLSYLQNLYTPPPYKNGPHYSRGSFFFLAEQ